VAAIALVDEDTLNNGAAVDQAHDAIFANPGARWGQREPRRAAARMAPKQRGGLLSPVFRNSNPTMNKEAQVRADVEALRSLGKDELRARWTKCSERPLPQPSPKICWAA
jgi:hypothetical protein